MEPHTPPMLLWAAQQTGLMAFTGHAAEGKSRLNKPQHCELNILSLP